jgi:hypothetical protein
MSGGWGTPSWMKVNEPQVGETFVSGKTQETARALLDAADAVGIARAEVRSVTGGFICPDAVWDHLEQQRTSSANI